MPTGTVKWFDQSKGYGFIKPDTGTTDIFVHVAAVKKANLLSLQENQRIEYQTVISRGRTSAVDLQLLG